MLEDGLLDAWLMQLFGRYVERRHPPPGRPRLCAAAVASGTSAWSIFDSIPLAHAVVPSARGRRRRTTATFFQIASVALLSGTRSRRNSNGLRALQRRRSRAWRFSSARDRPLLRRRRSPRADRIESARARAETVIAPLIAFLAGIVARRRAVPDLPRRARRARRVLRNVVRRHPAHHRRGLVAAVSGPDHDVPQQPQPAHAGGLRPLREVPISSSIRW